MRLGSSPLRFPLAESSRPRSVSTRLRTFAGLHSCTTRHFRMQRRWPCETRRVSSSGAVVRMIIAQPYGQNHSDSSGPNLDCTCNKERSFFSSGTALLPCRSKDSACPSATPLRCLVHLSTAARNNALASPMLLLSPPAE